MGKVRLVLAVLIFAIPMSVIAGSISGNVAVLHNYYNGNTILQLSASGNSSSMIDNKLCKIEDHKRGLGNVFQLGVVDDNNKLNKFYSQLLMAQASKKIVAIEFNDDEQGYCVITHITSFHE